MDPEPTIRTDPELLTASLDIRMLVVADPTLDSSEMAVLLHFSQSECIYLFVCTVCLVGLTSFQLNSEI